MSKLVKKLVSRDIANRLDGVNDAIVANIVGMTGEQNYNIRKTFRESGVKGGVMDGEALTADQVKKVSKWPSRQEQISMLVGQILSPGATLSGQLVGPARKIAGQVKKMIENLEENSDEVAESVSVTEEATETPSVAE